MVFFFFAFGDTLPDIRVEHPNGYEIVQSDGRTVHITDLLAKKHDGRTTEIERKKINRKPYYEISAGRRYCETRDRFSLRDPRIY